MNTNTLYVGETVRVAARVSDPDAGVPVEEATATVSVWGPGVDRSSQPPAIADKAMTYRSAQRDFVALLDTSVGTWPAGRYSYRVRVVTTDSDAGQVVSIEYATFQLNA